MASILDKYGIKEVCDFYIYNLENGVPTTPALYLDSLKVSNLEQSGDFTEARGGQGNAALIGWDSNKDITLSITDALFSAKSLAILFGNGKVATVGSSSTPAAIMKTEVFTATATTLPVEGTSSAGWDANFIAVDGKSYEKKNPKFYTEQGTVATALVVGSKFFCTYDLEMIGQVINIDSNTFPGTYYMVGDSVCRSFANGSDEYVQFIIPKGKIQTTGAINLSADGEPTTFDMSVKVLKPATGHMVQIVKYNLVNGEAVTESATTVLHNHSLSGTNVTG